MESLKIWHLKELPFSLLVLLSYLEQGSVSSSSAPVLTKKLKGCNSLVLMSRLY